MCINFLLIFSINRIFGGIRMKKRICNIMIYTIFLIQALIFIPLGTMFTLLPILECRDEYILWQLVGIILIVEPFIFYIALKKIIKLIIKLKASVLSGAFFLLNT